MLVLVGSTGRTSTLITPAVMRTRLPYESYRMISKKGDLSTENVVKLYCDGISALEGSALLGLITVEAGE